MDPLKFLKQLYVQVLIAIFLGVVLGYFYPELALKMKPLGDGFIKLIKMMITPIIFTTVVTGIASMQNIKEVGRVGIKALIYFELMTTLALIIGLIVANLLKPGAGLNIDPHSLNAAGLASYKQQDSFSIVNFLLNIIPDTLVSAFTQNDLLPVLLISILFGFGILHVGNSAKPLITLLDQGASVFFAMIGFIMKIAPIGAFGAMAYTVSAHGFTTVIALSRLIVDIYLTSFLFIFLVLGAIAKCFNFSLLFFLRYIKEELLIVLGTSSSEAVLPRMMKKLENIGCGKTIVGLVLPTGYTFNLDGTAIYLTMATLFIAQALNIPLDLGTQLFILAVLLLTSKGAAAVTGGGFIVLTATLTSLHTVPVEGVVLLLGVDKFMSEARALTNLIGNGVATIVIAKWEGDFDAFKALALNRSH